MPKKYCDQCNVTHTTLMCYQKPRKPIKTKKDLTWEQTKKKWLLRENTNWWFCYLQISDRCPIKLTKETMTFDHVIPRVRGSNYKYDIDNLKPACSSCNMLKGSRTLEALAREYPRLNQYI